MQVPPDRVVHDASFSAFVGIVDLMRSSPLTDIYVTGYVDDASVVRRAFLAGSNAKFRRFAPVWSAVYLEFGDSLVRLSVDVPTAGIRMERVTHFAELAHIEAPDELALTGLGGLLLNLEGEGVVLTSFEVIRGTPEQSSASVFRAMGFTIPHRYSFPRERYLFFDPLNLDGIAIGRHEEKAAWLRAAPDSSLQSWSFLNEGT